MVRLMSKGIESAEVCSFNIFADEFTNMNTSLPDGQVLSDSVVGARLVSATRNLGAEIAADLKVRIRSFDK